MLHTLIQRSAPIIAAALAASCVSASPVDPPTEARAPQAEEGYFPGADGARLFYRRVGNGRDALVYVHGGPASGSRGSGEFMEPLARGRILIMYDQRGAGLSEVVSDPGRLTMAHNIQDLEALRRHFGLERMTLIALSFGAAIAVNYATQHPERVARLILVSPMPPTRAHSRERARILDELLGPELVRRRDELTARLATASDGEIHGVCRELSDITFRLYLARPTEEKLEHAALRCAIPPAALRNRSLVRRVLGTLGDFDFRPMLTGIRAPTLVVEGTETNVPLDATRIWADTIPGARLVLISNAGHEFFVDQPVAFVREAERFLRATPRAPEQRSRE